MDVERRAEVEVEVAADEDDDEGNDGRRACTWVFCFLRVTPGNTASFMLGLMALERLSSSSSESDSSTPLIVFEFPFAYPFLPPVDLDKL